MAFLEVRHLSFSYPGGPRVLDNICFQVERGSYIVVAGGNGSGKSTLVRLLAGLLRPVEGQVLFGAEAFSGGRGEDSSFVGLVYQNPSHQIVAPVVREDTAFGPENLGLSSLEIQARVEEALGAVSLSAFAGRGTHELSAGQQQRLAMAGILALHRECLILDEADSMLNPQGRREMEGLLQELLALGCTIIRVSHNMDQAVGADRLLVLDEGRLVWDGGPEVLGEENLERWRLKVPGVLGLGRKIRERGLSFLGDSSGLPLSEEGLAGVLALESEGRFQGQGWACLELDGGVYREAGEGGRAGRDREDGREELVLEMEGVSCFYGYKGNKRNQGACPVKALEDVSFSLSRGESVVIAGATGSGKSTFLQVMNSLLLPSEGRIRILGFDPLDRKTDLSFLRTRVALVMQQPEKQLFAPLVGDDVAFGPRMAGLKGRELSLRVKEAMELAGLPFNQFRDRPVKSLSGGQKRKAAIAGILALKPELLLLDEPTAGLDPLGVQEMTELLLGLQARGLAQVIVSHSMEQALPLARRFVVLQEGHILYDGPVEAFFRGRLPEASGLEYPLSARLAMRLGCPGDFVPLNEEEFLRALEGFENQERSAGRTERAGRGDSKNMPSKICKNKGSSL